MAESFEQEWQRDNGDDMLSSQLLDSLDLGVVSGKPLGFHPPRVREEVDKLRELIGYESIVVVEKLEKQKERYPAPKVIVRA